MLIKCIECELQVSDKAAFCPHCGYPMKPSYQNKPRKSNKRRRLPNGFGQISEIKNQNLRNPFRAMVSVGKQPNGRPICKPLKPESYFPTYNDAYAALVEYNRNPYDLAPAITVKELYERWTEDYFNRVSESMIKATTGAWVYCNNVYNMRAADIRPRHIKGCLENSTALVKGVRKSPTPNMQNRIKTLFNQMFDYALEYEIVDRNHSRSFSLTDETVKDILTVSNSHIVYTDEEMLVLWNNLHIHNFVDVILIQCYSGWRPQELGNIKLIDVDTENWIFKGGIKTESSINRIVPIHTKIRPIILKKIEEAKSLNSEYLLNCKLNGKKNTTLSYPRYVRQFDKAIQNLQLNPNHRPHDGRTHFVTSAKKYELDEYAIKYIVGHKISDITEKTYTKREFEWLSTEIEKIK